MKRKITIIILALVCVASLFALTACGSQQSPEDFANQQGNTVKVILDSMNGNVSDYRLKPNSPIPQPGVTDGVKEPELRGYVFEGYYTGEKDADGNVTYGYKWDFSTKVNQDVTLYGKWAKQFVIRVNYMVDGQYANKYTEMDVLNNATSVTSIKEPTYSGHTYVEMYLDEAMTNVLEVTSQNPFTHGCTEENPVLNVYAKFIQGVWTLVRTANDMVNVNAGSRLYLMNDIDFAERNNAETGLTNISINRNTFVGAIEGNGYTIKNLHFHAKGEKGTTHPGKNNFGLFSKVQNVSIKNVTFENCSVVGTVESEADEYFYGFIAGTATGTNVFENITFKNCQVKQLQFNTITFTAEKIETLRARIDQNLFIATGSDFVPTVV